MADEFGININGYHVKEIRCKNDDCRSLFGYESIKIGVIIFRCVQCKTLSVFRVGYNEAAQKFMEELKKVQKGGEIKSG